MRCRHFLLMLSLGCLLTACSKASDVPAAPENPSPQAATWREQAQAKKAAGDLNGALELYEKARQASPGSLAILYDIVTTAKAAGRKEPGLQAIDAMFRLDPKLKTDTELLGFKSALETAPQTTPPPVKPASPPSGQVRLELNTMSELAREAQTSGDAEKRRQLLTDLLARTKTFTQEHPDQFEGWRYRAAAALLLKNPRVGWEAGQKLLALGALDRTEPQIQQLMTQLNLQHWLGKEPPPDPFAAVTREKPFVNSLGMKFVPVPGTDVLFSIWETRHRDYAAYGGEDRSWQNASYKNVPVGQGGIHPVVNVSWEDAKAFCAWLTAKEHDAGTIPMEAEYRLPMDWEWSVAVGLNEPRGGTPESKSGKTADQYPWGTAWPPPSGAGNYADATAQDSFGKDFSVIAGYQDGYATTAPVGSFTVNPYGLFDLGGNVWEWCEDRYDDTHDWRVLRGGSWDNGDPGGLLSSCRVNYAPGGRYDSYGFRVVLVGGSAR